MKRHKLPLKPYLKKYLQSSLADGVLKLETRVVRVTTNAYNVNQFFEKNRETTHWIYVEVASSSQYVLFGIYTDLQKEFRNRVFSVMAFAVKNGIPAIEAARKFLQEYDITDEEYSVESLYRTWLRRKEKFLNPTEPVVKKRKEKHPDSNIESKQLSLF